jgi:SAM-dependent methyltransferase
MLLSALRSLVAPTWETTRGKGSFVRAVPINSRVLDVGCGNNSPEWFKTIRPDIYYVGVDVADYNQAKDPAKFADEYLIIDPDDFAAKIEEFRGQMDAVVSSHNLEHCNNSNTVLNAMISALKPGGKIYLSFPCEESVNFPHRNGCLNFFDDSTHKAVPHWNSVVTAIKDRGCTFNYIAKRYRPFPLVLKGALLEPISAIRRTVMPDGSTWALYGFESVIWATAKSVEC